MYEQLVSSTPTVLHSEFLGHYIDKSLIFILEFLGIRFNSDEFLDYDVTFYLRVDAKIKIS